MVFVNSMSDLFHRDITARIVVGQPLHDIRRTQSLFQQLDRFRTVQAIRRGLSRDRANTGYRVWDRCTRGKRFGLNADAKVLRRRIECDDRKGREPSGRLRRVVESRVGNLRPRLAGLGQNQRQQQEPPQSVAPPPAYSTQKVRAVSIRAPLAEDRLRAESDDAPRQSVVVV
jgi:hypothetical protein